MMAAEGYRMLVEGHSATRVVAHRRGSPAGFGAFSFSDTDKAVSFDSLMRLGGFSKYVTASCRVMG